MQFGFSQTTLPQLPYFLHPYVSNSLDFWYVHEEFKSTQPIVYMQFGFSVAILAVVLISQLYILLLPLLLLIGIAIIGELSLFIQHSDGVQVVELQYASG